MDTQLLLKVLVGSHAHGLATEQSDRDFRSVFVTPTSQLLAIGGGGYNPTSWIEGDKSQGAVVDDTSYEVGHFLHLATKSNPSILEVFKAPVEWPSILGQFPLDDTHIGWTLHDSSVKLLDLFPHVWSSIGVYNAFKGYSQNQFKKIFLEDEAHVNRRWKYAIAYLRVLGYGIDLLNTGDFNVYVENEEWREYLRWVKCGLVSIGEIIQAAEELKERLAEAYKNNPDKQTNLEPINEYLLTLRKEVW